MTAPAIFLQPPMLKARGKLDGYVYQRVKEGLGNIPSDPRRRLQIRLYVIPRDPKTAPQLARRQQFANAVASWHTLTDQQKLQLNIEARPYKMAGINRYIRAWMMGVPWL